MYAAAWRPSADLHVSVVAWEPRMHSRARSRSGCTLQLIKESQLPSDYSSHACCHRPLTDFQVHGSNIKPDQFSGCILFSNISKLFQYLMIEQFCRCMSLPRKLKRFYLDASRKWCVILWNEDSFKLCCNCQYVTSLSGFWAMVLLNKFCHVVLNMYFQYILNTWLVSFVELSGPKRAVWWERKNALK
jgi:hypothetical protein